MDFGMVVSLYEIMSGDSSPEKYYPFIRLAVTEVTEMLRPDADISDMKLNFLSASLANYRIQKMLISNQGEYTLAGKGAGISDSPALKYAGELFRDYLTICGELVYPQNFMFISV